MAKTLPTLSCQATISLGQQSILCSHSRKHCSKSLLFWTYRLKGCNWKRFACTGSSACSRVFFPLSVCQLYSCWSSICALWWHQSMTWYKRMCSSLGCQCIACSQAKGGKTGLASSADPAFVDQLLMNRSPLQCVFPVNGFSFLASAGSNSAPLCGLSHWGLAICTVDDQLSCNVSEWCNTVVPFLRQFHNWQCQQVTAHCCEWFFFIVCGGPRLPLTFVTLYAKWLFCTCLHVTGNCCFLSLAASLSPIYSVFVCRG